MTGSTSTIAKFVSQKISKIRWKSTPKQVIQQSSVFACGSWDNEQDNRVSLWQVGDTGEGDASMDEIGLSAHADGEPRLMCEAPHAGDVTDLIYVDQEHIMVASSLGIVSLYRHHTNAQTLSVQRSWEGLHHHPAQPCPCTGIATKGDDTCVSVGEDGRIQVLSVEHRHPVRTIDDADSCTMNAVSFLKQSEVATVNSIGQLKVWDTRQSENQPARVFLLTGERVPLHCLDKHPTQPHVVATGGQDGTLSIWDMRQDKFPVTLLSAHAADMWEVRFHPSHPDHLFTCSEDGAVWHWDGTGMSTPTVTVTNPSLLQHTPKDTSLSLSMSLAQPITAKQSPSASASAWLSSEVSKHRLDITDLLPGNTMPVNSIDIESNTLLCASDGEQIYTVQNIAIK